MTSDARPVIETPGKCHVRVEGKELTNLISRVELDQYIYDHHVLNVTVKQAAETAEEREFYDPSLFASFLGKSISTHVPTTLDGAEGENALEFIGVITKVSFDSSIDSVKKIHITALSPTIALDGAKKNAFYHEMKASDIIGSIVRSYPMTIGKVDSTDGTYKFSVQYEESDFDYVMRLATGAGLFAFYDGSEFRAVKANSSASDEAVWPETLGAFTVGLGTSQTEFKSEVYNYEQKKTYTQDSKSISSTAALSDLSKISPEASAKIFDSSSFTKVVAVDDARSLDQILERERSRSVGKMISCSGESTVAKLSVGRCVKIKGMGKFDGTYWLTRVRHVFDESGKYHNRFECTPLDTAFPAFKSSRQAVTQLQPAVVVDNNDPEKLGRIKVKFPWSDSDETPWARYSAAHAGKDRGAYCIPEIDDEVLVGFEFGNPDKPIIVGSLYNVDDAPHSKTGSDENLIKAFITKSGNEVIFNDESGNEEIKISMKDGKNQIVLGLSGPSITITSEGDIGIKGANITIESSDKMTLKAGSDIEIKAQSNLKAEAGANLKSKAGASYDAEGAMVNVKGNPIKLN